MRIAWISAWIDPRSRVTCRPCRSSEDPCEFGPGDDEDRGCQRVWTEDSSQDEDDTDQCAEVAGVGVNDAAASYPQVGLP